MNKVLVIVAVLLLASAGRTGEVYKWVDERGVVHFTDNPSAVPAKYKKYMDRRDLPEPRGASSPSRLRSRPAMGEPRDRYGRGQDYWVNRKNEIKGRLYRAQREYERLLREYDDLVDSYSNTTSLTKRNEYKKRVESVRNELRRRSEDIFRVREMLEKTLPSEAATAGAPAEWLQ
jgi:hypothetical protein